MSDWSERQNLLSMTTKGWRSLRSSGSSSAAVVRARTGGVGTRSPARGIAERAGRTSFSVNIVFPDAKATEIITTVRNNEQFEVTRDSDDNNP
jgi:hypothetical protein